MTAPSSHRHRPLLKAAEAFSIKEEGLLAKLIVMFSEPVLRHRLLGRVDFSWWSLVPLAPSSLDLKDRHVGGKEGEGCLVAVTIPFVPPGRPHAMAHKRSDRLSVVGTGGWGCTILRELPAWTPPSPQTRDPTVQPYPRIT